MMVQFPIGFCPGSKEGIKLNCTGNFGIVLKEWETITRVSIICTTWIITSYFANWLILYNSRRATARVFSVTVAAPLIAAANNQKIIFGPSGAAST